MAYESGLTKFGKNAYALDIAVGVEFRKQQELLYIAIAKNNNGFHTINKFLSDHNHEKKTFPARAPQLNDVFIIYPFGKIDSWQLEADEFIGIRKHQLNQFAVYQNGIASHTKFAILHPVKPSWSL